MQSPRQFPSLVSRLNQSVAIIGLLFVFGCTHTNSIPDRSTVGNNVSERMSLSAINESENLPIIPPELERGDTLTEEHAILLALWNNPTFNELLTDLKLTKADLIQAELLPNPEVVYFFAVPDKPFKYALELPLEAFWLRPIRMKIAEEANNQASARLTQSALDLIRDTRLAYADAVLAKERLAIALQSVNLRTQTSTIAFKRLKSGDISLQEAATTRTDALLAQQDAIRVGYEVAFTEERLRNLMGLGGFRGKIQLEKLTVDPPYDLRVDDLVQEAIENRPDAQAAAYGVLAAEQRLRLAKLGWFRFLGILDATSGQDTGNEFGPAARLTLPIFNRNQGGIARAEGELEQAERRKWTVQNQIILDVRQSIIRYQQARGEMDSLEKKVRPELQDSIKRAEKAYEAGNATYLIVLETTRQLIDTLVREAQLRTDLRRALAEVERSVGRKLSSTSSGKTP
jgi:outer membrane protein, heavy metal efflux system